MLGYTLRQNRANKSVCIWYARVSKVKETQVAYESRSWTVIVLKLGSRIGLSNKHTTGDWKQGMAMRSKLNSSETDIAENWTSLNASTQFVEERLEPKNDGTWNGKVQNWNEIQKEILKWKFCWNAMENA